MSRGAASTGLIDVDALGSHFVVRAPEGAAIVAEARLLPEALAGGAPGRCHVPALPGCAAAVRRLAERHPGALVRPAAKRLLHAVEVLPATAYAVALPCEHRPGRPGVLVVHHADAPVAADLARVPGIRYDRELVRWWLPQDRAALDALAQLLDAHPRFTALPEIRRLVTPLVQPSLSPDAVAGLEHRCVVAVTDGRPGEQHLRLCRRCAPRLASRLEPLVGRVAASFDSWWVRLDDAHGDRLLDVLQRSADLDVPPAVLADARAALDRAREARSVEALSQAARPSAVISSLPAGLRDFQKAAVQYALAARRTFLADEPGLGKTVQALATLEAAGAFPALVVCPASLRLNWLREAQRWLPTRSTKVIAPGPTDGWPDVGLVSYDALHRITERADVRDLRALVVDEAHFCKNPAARRTRAAMSVARNVRPDAIVLLLTGTPVLNRPSELISQLELLDRLDEIGGRRLLSRLDGGGDELATVHRRLRRTCYVRRRKRDVLDQLPAKQRVVVPVEIANRREYEQVEDDVVRWLRQRAEDDERRRIETEARSGDERAAAVADGAEAGEPRSRSAEALVRLTTLALVSARGKLPMALEWIDAFLESGEKLVVFCRHREIARLVHAHVPHAALATGDLDPDARTQQVARFQSDPACRLIVGTLDAAGVGLTMTAASDVAFLEMAWTPAAHDQAEDRVHRIGQDSSVTAWYLLAEGTIDERVAAVLDRKRRLVDATSDGASGDEQSTLRELTDWLVHRRDTPQPAPAGS